ncbi:hypothetical protein [Marinobacter sp.]|uniref:hypothetical protein n=1 Tax=Marinobacter sp. TaxID=50741 RepID=UPI003F976F4D
MSTRSLKVRIHASAGILATLTIATFWSSTLISELFLSATSVIWVKQQIVLGMFVLIPLLMITGGSGFSLGRKSTLLLVQHKRRRMPIIALNGLLILLPCALFLSWKAQQVEMGGWFYTVQVLELTAGAINLLLMGRNARDGMRLRKPQS